MVTPFDLAAMTYDEDFTHSQIGKLQRNQVWQYLQSIVLELSGKRIFEINCGTGEDALIFAQQGFSVVATDLSAQMVTAALQKANINLQVTFEQLSATDIDKFNGQTFDLIFSNFAGLNCLNVGELTSFINKSHQLLNPNGRMIVVMFSTCCMWEIIYYTLKLKWGTAWRRFKSFGQFKVRESEQTIWYYSIRKFKKLVSSHYQVEYVKPIGLFVPPSYLENFFSTKPRLLNLLASLDSYFRWPIVAPLSDHYLIDIRKR